jgi:predicted RNA-binding Zn-ribbon protein involved in translation (DUF1610 family)
MKNHKKRINVTYQMKCLNCNIVLLQTTEKEDLIFYCPHCNTKIQLQFFLYENPEIN